MQQLLLRVGLPLAALAGLALAWQRFGWQGVLVVASALAFWLMLHFNRTMQVMQRAANRPIGSVASAVMLNAKLKPGVSLLHVMALTRALGEMQSVKDEQPEVYRWRDNSDSFVDATFQSGRLTAWQLVRPAQPPESPSDAAANTKIGRFGAAVSHREPSVSSFHPHPGTKMAPDNKE